VEQVLIVNLSLDQISEMVDPPRVCLCRNVTHERLVEAVRKGANSLGKLARVTFATTGCGTCLLEVKAILDEEREKERVEQDEQARLF